VLLLHENHSSWLRGIKDLLKVDLAMDRILSFCLLVVTCAAIDLKSFRAKLQARNEVPPILDPSLDGALCYPPPCPPLDYLGIPQSKSPLFPKIAATNAVVPPPSDSTSGQKRATLDSATPQSSTPEADTTDTSAAAAAVDDSNSPVPGALKAVESGDSTKTCSHCPAEFLIRVRHPPPLPSSADGSINTDSDSSLQADREALADLEKRIQQRQDYVVLHSKWISEAQQAVQAIEQEVAGAGETKQSIQSQLQELQKQKLEIETKIKRDRLEQDLGEAQDAMKKLEEQTKGLSQEKDDLGKQRGKIDSEMQALQAKIDAIKQQGDGALQEAHDEVFGDSEADIKAKIRKAAG
jgi:hypothetical protein